MDYGVSVSGGLDMDPFIDPTLLWAGAVAAAVGAATCGSAGKYVTFTVSFLSPGAEEFGAVDGQTCV